MSIDLFNILGQIIIKHNNDALVPFNIKSSGNATIFYVDGTGVCRATGQSEAPIYHAT